MIFSLSVVILPSLFRMATIKDLPCFTLSLADFNPRFSVRAFCTTCTLYFLISSRIFFLTVLQSSMYSMLPYFFCTLLHFVTLLQHIFCCLRYFVNFCTLLSFCYGVCRLIYNRHYVVIIAFNVILCNL